MDEVVTKLLLIDYETLFCEGIKHLLERDEPSFDVVAPSPIETEEEMLRLVHDHKPDVVILDMDAPFLSHENTIEILVKQFPNIDIIVFTSNENLTGITKATMAGAHGYLLKEMDVKRLIEAVKDVRSGGASLHPSVTKKLMEAYRQLAHTTTPKPSVNPLYILTNREYDVLRLLVKGKSNPELAKELNISEKTVKNHVSSILSKLALKNRTEVVIAAIQKGWVTF